MTLHRGVQRLLDLPLYQLKIIPRVRVRIRVRVRVRCPFID